MQNKIICLSIHFAIFFSEDDWIYKTRVKFHEVKYGQKSK